MTDKPDEIAAARRLQELAEQHLEVLRAAERREISRDEMRRRAAPLHQQMLAIYERAAEWDGWDDEARAEMVAVKRALLTPL